MPPRIFYRSNMPPTCFIRFLHVHPPEGVHRTSAWTGSGRRKNKPAKWCSRTERIISLAAGAVRRSHIAGIPTCPAVFERTRQPNSKRDTIVELRRPLLLRRRHQLLLFRRRRGYHVYVAIRIEYARVKNRRIRRGYMPIAADAEALWFSATMRYGGNAEVP